MAWRRNKKLTAQGLSDLVYLPRDRSQWDCSLSALAYGARRRIEGGRPDLAAWAVRHGLPVSARYLELGEDAAVLWHGTSRPRAEKIAEHGLFHKRGLWTTSQPEIAHGYTRSRADRFATEGAMVCLVLDRRAYQPGRDYEVEPNESIFRFQHGLPPDVVEYVLFHDEIRFAGAHRAPAPAAWPGARFKRRDGLWVPVQKAPVRYSESAAYSTPAEFADLCLRRLLDELGSVAAVELFSVAYSRVTPWEALTHDELLDLLFEQCVPASRRSRKVQTFRSAR